jgi:hypothetical protein
MYLFKTRTSKDMKKDILEILQQHKLGHIPEEQALNELCILSSVVLSLNYNKAKELFNELINAGRDMERRDNLNQPYISGDEYLHNVLDRYKPQ